MMVWCGPPLPHPVCPIAENIEFLLVWEQPEMIPVFAAVHAEGIEGLPVRHPRLWVGFTKRDHGGKAA